VYDTMTVAEHTSVVRHAGCRLFSFLLRRLAHDFLHLVSRKRVRPAWARRVLLQRGETSVQKAIASARCLLGRDSQLTGDILVPPAICSMQDDPRPFHFTGRQRSGAGLLFQLLSLFGIQNNGASYTPQSPSKCMDAAGKIIVTSYDALH
jgi:hypothetical protein